MAENKIQPTEASVSDFIAEIEDQSRRDDSKELLDLMTRATGEQPSMWGEIVGFGSYHYRYESGREGDWFRVGFAPRKNNLTVYLATGFEPHQSLLEKLGRHSTGKSCLYIKSLEDVDQGILENLVANSYSSPAMGET